MPKIKLKSISFGNHPFRKLRNIEIPIADRITIIAGHNGIGKSTVLGLIASISGITNKEFRSYFDKPFSLEIGEIIHLDPIELEEGKLSLPWPKLV